MKALEELRTEIDEIDSRLIVLLNDRARVALEVGKVKERTGSPIFAPDREARLLQALEAKNAGPLPTNFLRAVFREILSASRGIEKMLTIAVDGLGTWLAARDRFGACVRYVSFDTTRGVFDALGTGEADLGVVPIEAPNENPSRSTVEAFLASKVGVCGQIELRHAGAVTRFYVVGDIVTHPSLQDRTAMLVCLQDRPGALISALEPFSAAGINLHRVNSSSVACSGSGGDWFFVEVEVHREDAAFVSCLSKLRSHCVDVRVLGSFARERAG